MRPRGGAEIEGYKPSQDKVEKKTLHVLRALVEEVVQTCISFVAIRALKRLPINEKIINCTVRLYKGFLKL